MNSPKSQVEFITRLVYNLDGLPGRLKLYFSQFLSFHFSKILSPEQIQHIENKKASHPFANDEEMVLASKDFTLDEKVWVVASLTLLRSEAEKIDDRVFSLKTDLVIRKITDLLGLQSEGERVQAERSRLEAEANRFQNRKLIHVAVGIGPLVADFALRCLALLYMGYAHSSEGFLLGANTFYIPAMVLMVTWWLGKRNERRNQQILEAYGGAANFRLDYRLSTWQYTLLAFFLFTGVFVGYLLPDQLHMPAFIGLSLYYFVCIRFFLIGRIDENELVRQIEGEDQNLHSLNRDENDEVIVSLETKLNSLTGRLEAYVLESALFGALTFSGFLQIMSSELVTFEALERFATAIFDSARGLIVLDASAFSSASANLNNKVSLFCLVSVESLLCSVFFLAVIASRLRFSNVADKVRTAINLAKVYNAKEEAFYQEEDFSEKKSARLAALNSKVNEQLQATVDAMREVEPVMTYMQYFRNAGILVFLLILLSSTLFITSVVGWTFLSLVFATYLYFNRQAIAISFRVTYLNLRIQFSRRSGWLLAAVISLFVLASVLRDVFLWAGGGFFITLGYVAIGIYLFLWLLFAAHVDDEFGEIDKGVDARRIGRWNYVKYLLAAMILFYCMAMGMKYSHLSGANALIMISLSTLSILSYFVGYYLSKIRWLGMVCGGMMATFSIGILFKTLHLNGANEMLLIGMVSEGVLIPIILWQRKKFHILFLKFCFAAFLISFVFLSGILVRIEIALSHRTWDIAKILSVANFELDQDLEGSLARSDWYIQEYGATPGFAPVYSDLMRQYRVFSRDEILEPAEVGDTTMLQKGLLVAKQITKIQALFDYDPDMMFVEDLEIEPDILVKMNRKEEAIDYLEGLIEVNPHEESKEVLRTKLKEIRESGSD